MTGQSGDEFKFEISLSVLNHLGRNLYRNFITVLGEAISNSWDADATTVHIGIDRANGHLVVKDNGVGMNAVDFQGKFLKVGYSKRKSGDQISDGKRPFMGAKGIGKLALLSCAETITILSKKKGEEIVGGVIDNSGLDKAILDDVSSSEYVLEAADIKKYQEYFDNIESGTILIFKNLKGKIRNKLEHIRKMVALNFRFSLIDSNFKITINGIEVGYSDLSDLSSKTQFLWVINNHAKDDFVNSMSKLERPEEKIRTNLGINGFIGSVKFPTNLKIVGNDERASVDLFVNGRLRERDILKHFPTARLTESYLYGQVHYNELDGDGKDRFTSSREGVLEGDEKYQLLIDEFKKKILPKILKDWDKFRDEAGQDGDDQAGGRSILERRSTSIYNEVAKDYKGINKKSDKWIKNLNLDANFNIPSYVHCFLSENLIRLYIKDKSISIDDKSEKRVTKYRGQEAVNKGKANINFPISRDDEDLCYLSIDHLAALVEGKGSDISKPSLVRDSIEYVPMRNAVAHTAVLSELAKSRLELVYQNVKARIQDLLK